MKEHTPECQVNLAKQREEWEQRLSRMLEVSPDLLMPDMGRGSGIQFECICPDAPYTFSVYAWLEDRQPILDKIIEKIERCRGESSTGAISFTVMR
jgi:hypothetical protein